MCVDCESYDAHHIGHIHRPGKKVVRRHNGRLVTERLRRPLLHLHNGSGFVGYCSHPRFGTLSDHRRRGRSGSLRQPMRMAGLGMWGGEDGGYYARGLGMMQRGPVETGYSPHAMFEDGISSLGAGFGHVQGHGFGNGFHADHDHQACGHRHGGGPRHSSGNCGRYTTNDGMSGMVEEREPGRGHGNGYGR